MSIIPSANYFPAGSTYLRNDSNSLSTEEFRKREEFHATPRPPKRQPPVFGATQPSWNSFKFEPWWDDSSSEGSEKIEEPACPTLSEQRYGGEAFLAQHRYEMLYNIPLTKMGTTSGKLLIQAAKKGDFADVLYWIRNKDRANLHPNDWGTAVCCAMQKGHLDVVKALAKDREMFSEEERGYAVWLTAEKGLVGFLHVLLADGAEIDKEERQLGLRLAQYHNHAEAVEILLADREQLAEKLRKHDRLEEFKSAQKELSIRYEILTPGEFAKHSQRIKVRFPEMFAGEGSASVCQPSL